MSMQKIICNKKYLIFNQKKCETKIPGTKTAQISFSGVVF